MWRIGWKVKKSVISKTTGGVYFTLLPAPLSSQTDYPVHQPCKTVIPDGEKNPNRSGDDDHHYGEPSCFLSGRPDHLLKLGDNLADIAASPGDDLPTSHHLPFHPTAPLDVACGFDSEGNTSSVLDAPGRSSYSSR